MGLRIRRQSSLVELLETRWLLSTIYVDAGATGSTHDGISWGTAFTDLQSAITADTSGAQIDVAGGTYKPTSGTDRTASFNLLDGISINGGFAGSAGSNPDERDVAEYPTILSGDIGTLGDTSDNSYHLVVGSNVTLDGLTLEDANADQAHYDDSGNIDSGAAFYSPSGSPTINDCIFLNNLAEAGSSDDNCAGAGIYCVGGSITNCTFTNNATEINGTTYSAGGAVDIVLLSTSSPVTISNCAFTNNSSNYGGAINTSTGYETFSPPMVTINDCTFYNNSAQSIGGAINDTGNSIVTANNCIFVHNVSPNGGAFGVWGGTYSSLTNTFNNCTFVDNNTAIEDSPGNTPPQLVVNNGIFWNNGLAIITQAGVPTTVNYSDIQGGFAGTGNIDADPQFIRDPGPGTDGIWGTSDDDYGNLQLQQTSPCIDAGDNSAVPAGTVTDLAGNPRFVDVPAVADTGNGTPPIVDMGAYETSPTIAATAGGPYTVIQGQSITLNGSGISNVTGALQYAWDFSGNGQFTDATGADPSFAATLQTTPGNHTVTLRVTNADGQSAIDTAMVDVTAATLQADAGGPYVVVAGKSLTLSGGGTTNTGESLQYAWDFSGNGQFTDATGTNPVFSAANFSAGTNVPVALEVTDADGQSSVSDTTVDVEGATIYVDPHAPGMENGSDWENAFTNLAAALSQAIAGQTIDVTAGTYYPTINSDRTATFSLKDGVEIDGGYDGFGATNPDARNLDPNVTILSGNLGGSSNSDDSYHVVTANGVDSTAILDDVTVKDGYADGSDDADQMGGGIYIANASPTIRDSFIYQNFANIGGGGIYDSDSSPTITNCRIENNSANADGGGIRNDDSSPAISDSHIDNNTVSGTDGDEAGGGAMANYDGSAPTIQHCYIDYNRANSGGAIFDSDSDPAFSYCNFVDNSASAANGGGGVFFNTASSPSMTNCTIAANQAASAGGAIYDTSSSSPTVINCILWGDLTGSNENEITDVSSSAAVTYSDVDGGELGTGNINVDPQFVVPPSPGPDGVWGTNDDNFGDIGLLSTSPAIGSGNISAGSSDMGRFDPISGPSITSITATPDSPTADQKVALAATAISTLASDPVKSVAFYIDSNSNLSFDSSDELLGKAHHGKNGWTLTTSASKLPSGNIQIYAVVIGKDGKQSDVEDIFLDVGASSAPTIKKFSVKVKRAKKGSDKSGSTSIVGVPSSSNISSVVLAEDTNGDGIFDSGDTILYDGPGKHALIPFDGTLGVTYQFFIEERGTNGQWSAVSQARAMD